MSYFEGQAPSPGWQQHQRHHSFDQSAQSPARSGASPTLQYDDGAFGSQFEEIARASENLSKSGRAFGFHGRRESLPAVGNFSRQYAELDPRAPGPSRHYSVGEYDAMRSHSSHSSSSLQGYLANQRFGPPRQSEAEQAMQAKRRAAAQRERELRNYHQEQQYNRNASGAKSDRPLSPGSMNEDDRRDLIARQHRALYGDGANLYTGEGSNLARPVSQDARVLATGPSSQSPSSLGFDSFGAAGPSASSDGGMATAARSRAESSTSKAQTTGSFAMFDQPANRAAPGSSSPGNSPTRQGSSPAVPAGTGGVAPIGTRPTGQANLPKRNTPPMSAGLGYGFSNEKSTERSQSAASNPSNPSNPSSANADKSVGIGGWNGNSGPWGNSKNVGVQPSVWA